VLSLKILNLGKTARVPCVPSVISFQFKICQELKAIIRGLLRLSIERYLNWIGGMDTDPKVSIAVN